MGMSLSRVTGGFAWTAMLDTSGSTGRSVTRTERVLAVGRAFLTVTGVIAIFLDPTEPARLREATYVVLLAYAVYSLGVLAFVNAASRVTRQHTLAIHGLDILWASALTFVSEGPVSPFFLFFLFLLLAAANRWGFRETAGTAGITVAIFLVETALASVGPWRDAWFSSIQFELNRTILRVAYLMLTGVLLGYLAQQEKESRSETTAMALAARQPKLQAGLGGSAVAVARLLLGTFNARSVVLVVRDEETRRTLLWRCVRGDTAPTAGAGRLTLTPEQDAEWLFGDPGSAWFVDRPARTEGWDVAWVTEADAWKLRRAHVIMPPLVRLAQADQTMSVVNLGLEHEWSARAYLFDATAPAGIERRLHFLEDSGGAPDTGDDQCLPRATSTRAGRVGRTGARRPRTARRRHPVALRHRHEARGDPSRAVRARSRCRR
ncbi:MAG: hypothetical protein QM736_15595 [Vicinamibacterales bacterium]